MAIVIIQLSDLHFAAGENYNILLERKEELCGALRAQTSPGDSCAVIVSGDIVNRGQREGYKVAEAFLETVFLELSDHLGNDPYFAFVPGNHDHDFSDPSYDEQMRTTLIENTNPSTPPSMGMHNVLMATQEPYRKFVVRVTGNLPALAVDDLFASGIWESNGESLQFHMLNTTRFTRAKEQPGRTWYPIDLLENQIAQTHRDGVLTVGILHHPYNWHHPDNAKQLKQVLESHCDIIFTGHEHDAGQYTKQRKSTEQNLYVEGGVLQDHENTDLSTFNVVAADLARQVFSCRTITWNGAEYEAAENPSEHRYLRLRRPLQDEFTLETEWLDWLEEIGTDFRHPRARTLRLSDLFVYPDLGKLDLRKGGKSCGLVRDREVLGFLQEKHRVLIAGAEKTGKTSLAKTLFRDLREAGLVPVLIRSDFSVSRQSGKTHNQPIHDAFDKAINRIYSSQSTKRYWKSRIEERALIIDDYQRLQMNADARQHLLSWCDQNFGVVVVLADPSIRMQEILIGQEVDSALWAYDHVDILECDAETRDTLIGNWLKTGTDVFDYEEEGISQKKLRFGQAINTLIGQGAIPSVPLFVLMLMQQLEAGTTVGAPTGLYGSLYELIIRDVVKGVARRTTDVEVLLNYLAEFAHAVHTGRHRAISEENFRNWHAAYCKEYSADLNPTATVRALAESGIVKAEGASIRFKRRYYYCFFLAKYFANHIHEDEDSVLAEIFELCSHLHQTDAANTMMFLCHLCRDPRIIDYVLSASRSCFDNMGEFELSSSQNLLPKQGPGPVPLRLPNGSLEEERVRELRRRDDVSRPNGLAELDDEEDPSVSTEDLQLLHAMNSAHHAVLICGQIVRNFFGTLRGDRQAEIIRECYGATLRMMSAFIDLLEQDKEAFAGMVAERLRLRYPAMDEMEVERRAKASVHYFGVSICFALVKHASTSVGLADLKTTFDRILGEADDNVSIRIMDLSTRLDFLDGFPDRRIIDMADELEEYSIGYEVLRGLVWNHLKLFECDYEKRQRVCQKLGIGGSEARFLVSRGKRLKEHKGPFKRG
ncbi:MAG: metallophosphoesterase [Planctomycetes bacterium]|nr:metallophosphoesterase [Planctomycetota bacterium]